MKNKYSPFVWLILAAFALGLSGAGLAANQPALAAPASYPPDPTSDIPWSGGTSSVTDVQNAFNNARTQENTQLGTSIPMMILPSQSVWDSMNDNQHAAWLINRERVDRGVHPLIGPEPNVIDVAQDYAEYLLINDKWGHTADGHNPQWRMLANPVINACHDTYYSECLAVFVTSGSSIALPVERAIYAWNYVDSGSLWGHRHAILYYPYNDNSGMSNIEGFFGIGRASGGPYQGPFSDPWNFAELIVFDTFDPCSSWHFDWSFLPLIRK